MTRFDEYGAYGENNGPNTRPPLTAHQIAHMNDTAKRARALRHMGHTEQEIAAELFSEGYAAAAILAATGRTV